MKNGSNGQNCSFSSYITSKTEAGRSGFADGAPRRGGSDFARHGGSDSARHGSNSGDRGVRGIFSEVRRMRNEDEKTGARRRGIHSVRFSRRAEPSAAAQAGKFAVLLACICAFSLIFALKMANSDMQGETLAVFRSATSESNGEETDEETLGRLKLVRLPGLLSVFAASDSPIAPLSAEQAITDDSFIARLFSSPGAEVISMLSGTVRSVDPAGEHGGSVTVACKNGVDITYMGLGEILVERGQPVLQRTALGKLSGEILYLRVTKDGAPMDPLEFLGTAARVG